MISKVKSPDKILPVFHMHENFKYLKQILDYRFEDGRKIQYIGISPANDSSVKNKDKWLSEVYSFIERSSNPEVKTHLFGMTSFDLLLKYPATSADSTSYLMAAVYGGIFSSFGTINVSNRRLSDKKNYYFLPDDAKQVIDKEVASRGFNVKELSNDANKRKIYNTIFWHDFINTYINNKTSIKENKKLF